MRELQAEFGMAVMFITHDLGVVAEIADEVAVMYLGRVVERGTSTRSSTTRSIPTPGRCSRSIPRSAQPRRGSG